MTATAVAALLGENRSNAALKAERLLLPGVFDLDHSLEAQALDVHLEFGFTIGQPCDLPCLIHHGQGGIP